MVGVNVCPPWIELDDGQGVHGAGTVAIEVEVGWNEREKRVETQMQMFISKAGLCVWPTICP